MSEFKEFQGKTLDEAIETACDFYNLKRDRLEIEILKGGSTGIFGLVGAKKAKVKARPRAAASTEELLNGSDKTDKKPAKKTAPKKKPAKKSEPRAPKGEKKADKQAVPGPIPGPIDDEASPAPKAAPAPKQEAPARDRGMTQAEEDMAALDKDKVEAVVREVTTKLLTPIVGEPTLEISFDPDRVKVFIDDEENSGLIIGREGQTLSSLQYLVNRLVSREMEASVRIQIDTGEYRERQDEKLRQIAAHLADKACRIGRTQSTKPLSSYHRRVVHLALQESEKVFTRSKGDGPMKRVLIVPKSRKSNNGRARY